MLARHFPARAAACVRRGRTEIDNCLVDARTAASTGSPECLESVPTSSHARVPASAVAACTEARSGANESTRSRGHVSMANTVVVLADSDRARSQLMLWCR